MQRKRNIQLLFLLAALTVTTVVLWFMLNSGGASVVDKNIFKVEDLKSVDKIILQKGTDTVILALENSRWKVNGELADRDMMDVLFATLQQAEPKRPVSASLRDSINAILNTEGVKVTLFKGDHAELNFIAGGNTSKTQAYFKNTEAETYIMFIPGYRVYTSGIFELPETGWKDKHVFSFNWRNFKTLNATFYQNPQNDFEVAMGKSYFEVRGLSTVDTTKVNDFLDAMSLLTVDRYLDRNNPEGYDSLLNSSPAIRIAITDVAGQYYTLDLYPFTGKDWVLGKINGVQPAVFDLRKVSALVKPRSWFIHKGT